MVKAEHKRASCDTQSSTSFLCLPCLCKSRGWRSDSRASCISLTSSSTVSVVGVCTARCLLGRCFTIIASRRPSRS